MQIVIDNIATIIIALVVLCIVILVIVKMLRDKRKGKNTCGCDCSACGRPSCH